MNHPALKSIVYVEDELDIQQVAKLSLEAVGGYTVRCCSSGKEALEVIANYRPQVILLDVMMPDMDGPATFRALRESPASHDIPVIFMTAKAQVHEVEHYKAMGAIGVIPKPFDPMLLPGLVQELWEKAA